MQNDSLLALEDTRRSIVSLTSFAHEELDKFNSTAQLVHRHIATSLSFQELWLKPALRFILGGK